MFIIYPLPSFKSRIIWLFDNFLQKKNPILEKRIIFNSKVSRVFSSLAQVFGFYNGNTKLSNIN